jgi:hypothetical protein
MVLLLLLLLLIVILMLMMLRVPLSAFSAVVAVKSRRTV